VFSRGGGSGELDGQHRPTLIPDAHPLTGRQMPGVGHILVFDNGRYRRDSSRVLEIDPVSAEIVWSSPADWYSWHISGAERLPNGNTFICDGPAGPFFEITPRRRTVWEYRSPVAGRAGEGRAERTAHDDIGGTDSPRDIYRPVRYHREYVGKIPDQHRLRPPRRRAPEPSQTSPRRGIRMAAAGPGLVTGRAGSSPGPA